MTPPNVHLYLVRSNDRNGGTYSRMFRNEAKAREFLHAMRSKGAPAELYVTTTDWRPA